MLMITACSGEILKIGKIGETYNIGGQNESTNIELVNLICSTLDIYVKKNRSRFQIDNFVKDRPGHDYRYSINAGKIESALNWNPSVNLENGIKKTLNGIYKIKLDEKLKSLASKSKVEEIF